MFSGALGGNKSRSDKHQKRGRLGVAAVRSRCTTGQFGLRQKRVLAKKKPEKASSLKGPVEIGADVGRDRGGALPCRRRGGATARKGAKGLYPWLRKTSARPKYDADYLDGGWAALKRSGGGALL